MSNISAGGDLGKIKEPIDFMREASQVIKDLVDTINGKIEFTSQNMKLQIVSVTFSAANANTTVTHGLKKTGVSYIPISKSAACDVYNGVGTATSSSIFLKGTAAATVSLLLF